MANEESVGLTRREALKRGLKLTGAVMWATPVVQAVGMRPAFAQTVSQDPCLRTAAFRAKSDGTDDWEDDPGFGAQDCISCGGADGVNGSNFFTISGDSNSVTVTLTDPDCQITAIASKGGNEQQHPGSCGSGTVAPDGQSATVGRPPNGRGISHVEVCFSCCLDE
jgi:hypothetical protein